MFAADFGLPVNEVMCHKLSSVSRRAIIVAGPSVWNSVADHQRHPVLELSSFRRLLRHSSLYTIYRHNVPSALEKL